MVTRLVSALALLLLLDGARAQRGYHGTLSKDDGGGGGGGAFDVIDDNDPPRGCGERIVVVGGGFAGLAAARDLLRAGHADVTVVEARDEVGGRCATLEVEDAATGRTWPGITLGAHWIVGSEPGETVDLFGRSAAHEYALLAGVPEGDFQRSWSPGTGYEFLPQGRVPPNETSVELRGELLTPQQAVKEEFFAQCKKNWISKAAKENPVSRNWAKAFNVTPPGEQSFSEVAEAILVALWQEEEYAAPRAKDDMWAGQCWEGVDLTSEHNLRNGWTPIYEWLEEDIKSMGGTIAKNTRVQRVERVSGPGVPPVQLTVRSARGPPKLLPADRVVSTLSVGVMKQVVQDKLLTFSPGLPGSYKDALQSLSSGQLEKIVLFFPTKFWRKTRYWINEGNRSLYLVGHVPKKIDGIKFAGILYHVENSSVVFVITGDDVVEYMKDIREGTQAFEDLKTTVTDQAMEAVRDMFANDDRFLGADGNPVTVEEPLRDLTVLTNWMTDPNFLGSYAYLNTKAGPRVTQYEEGPENGLPSSHAAFDGAPSRYTLFEGYSRDRLALGAPASEGAWAGRLFFAGEATSLGLPALVPGAIESGRRAAIEVADRSLCGKKPASTAPTTKPTGTAPTMKPTGTESPVKSKGGKCKGGKSKHGKGKRGKCASKGSKRKSGKGS